MRKAYVFTSDALISVLLTISAVVIITQMLSAQQPSFDAVLLQQRISDCISILESDYGNITEIFSELPANTCANATILSYNPTDHLKSTDNIIKPGCSGTSKTIIAASNTVLVQSRFSGGLIISSPSWAVVVFIEGWLV